MKSIVKQIIKRTNVSEQEAWWMLQHITNRSKETLLFSESSTLSKKELQTIEEWIYKLDNEHQPLSYLLGSVPFLDLTIFVATPILIPRPETEEWIFNLITKLQPYTEHIKTVLDIGTGSGCIALALAKHFPKAQVIATDINPQALQLAQKNAQKNGIENVDFLKSDLFENLHNKKFDLIVSNPPYIDPANKLMPQVVEWEDNKALFAQDHGLKLIKKIIQSAPDYIHKNVNIPYQLVIEHDAGQENIIKDAAQEYGLRCTAQKDAFGNYRTSWCTFIN